MNTQPTLNHKSNPHLQPAVHPPLNHRLKVRIRWDRIILLALPLALAVMFAVKHLAAHPADPQPAPPIPDPTSLPGAAAHAVVSAGGEEAVRLLITWAGLEAWGTVEEWLHIAHCETGGTLSYTLHGDRNWTHGSYGLWQIHWDSWGHRRLQPFGWANQPTDLFDPWVNTWAARYIVSNTSAGLNSWTCHRH